MWFVFALAASLSWGISYTLSAKMLQNGLSVPFIMLISALNMVFFAIICSYFSKTAVFKESFELIQSGKIALWMLALVIASGLAGVYFINVALSLHNPTSVSMVEIAYPLFTILFSWLFFREVHLNPPTIVGGMMILGGSMLLLWKG